MLVIRGMEEGASPEEKRYVLLVMIYRDEEREVKYLWLENMTFISEYTTPFYSRVNLEYAEHVYCPWKACRITPQRSCPLWCWIVCI